MIHATPLSILTILNDYLKKLFSQFLRAEAMKYLLVCCMEVRPAEEVARDAGICRFYESPFDQ